MNHMIEQLIEESNTVLTPEELKTLKGIREKLENEHVRIELDEVATEGQRVNGAERPSRGGPSVIRNHGTGARAFQFMASTDGTIINGINKAEGADVGQVGGHYDGATVRQLSSDVSLIHLQNALNADKPPSCPTPSDTNGHDTTANSTSDSATERGLSLRRSLRQAQKLHQGGRKAT